MVRGLEVNAVRERVKFEQRIGVLSPVFMNIYASDSTKLGSSRVLINFGFLS